MERVESNGLLFGVLPETEYPVCSVPLTVGSRLLLYTDGITEPENAEGTAFGDRRLSEVLSAFASKSVGELSQGIVNEIGLWQSKQQDDRTLVLIDVVGDEDAHTTKLQKAASLVS